MATKIITLAFMIIIAARVNGGTVRVELFQGLKDAIATCLASDNDEFTLGWGLWFLS